MEILFARNNIAVSVHLTYLSARLGLHRRLLKSVFGRNISRRVFVGIVPFGTLLLVLHFPPY
jgi:hypothetical protein